MKNNIEYYKHFTNSHNHWKFKKLRRKYGFAGEGKFWALNNLIADAENCKLDLSDTDKKETTAIDLDFEVNEFDEFLLYLVADCKLVKQDEKGQFFTENVKEVLFEVMKKRERDRKAKTGKSLAKLERSLAKSDNSLYEKQQSKVKESKEDVVVESATATTASADIKKSFLLDLALLNSWMEKGLSKEKFEHGIDTFINHALKEVYKENDTPKRHFVNWMLSYPKASQTVLKEIKGVPQPKLSY